MKLQYSVLHSQAVQNSKDIEYEGQPATVTITQMVVEATPIEHNSGTLTLRLPAGTIVKEGDMIDVIVNEGVPVAAPAPAPVQGA
jgi:hypothetical protein